MSAALLPAAAPEDLKDKRVWMEDSAAKARDIERWRAVNAYYHRQVAALLRSIIPEGARVLDVGCGDGDLLAALRPSLGVGLDFSEPLLEVARRRHPDLRFLLHDAEALEGAEPGGPFDYIVLSDVVGSLVDVWRCLRGLRRLCGPETRVVVTYYNYLWEPALVLAERLGFKRGLPRQNWLPVSELENLLALTGFEPVRRGAATLMPLRVPLLADWANRYLAALPGLSHLCLTSYVVARPKASAPEEEYSVTVVIPTRNEADNVDPLVERTPEMGAGTEIIFVDGNSSDGTVERIEAAIERTRGRRTIRLVRQGSGRGKADAVHKGFALASGDILMILDADVTVLPEELPKFYLALAEGRAEFVNGSRLVYPMDQRAMRPLNLLGNKFFSAAVSWLLGQRVRDTLCGTKVFFRRDYARIMSIRERIGPVDPFGDFELLFGAAYGNLRIVDMPIRYRERTYGETKISRFRHGWMLLKMCASVFFRLKAIRGGEIGKP